MITEVTHRYNHEINVCLFSINAVRIFQDILRENCFKHLWNDVY